MRLEQAEDRLISKAFESLKTWIKDYPDLSFNPNAANLTQHIENTPLENLLSARDFDNFYLHMFEYFDKHFDSITLQEFSQQFRERMLINRVFDFYFPVYCLYEFPEDLKIGFGKVKPFDNLPSVVSEYFVKMWNNPHPIAGNYYRYEDKDFTFRKIATFITLEVRANAVEKAFEQAKKAAEDCLNIIRLICKTDFQLVDIVYRERAMKKIWAYQELSPFPSNTSARYTEESAQKFSELTQILTKPTTNEIERRIINGVRIFGLQIGLSSYQIRLSILMTCLESLLMTEGDKDYLLMKLAEKSAFVLGKEMKSVNNQIREAYRKRSAFIHGKRNADVSEEDIVLTERITADVMWRLIRFAKQGYIQVQKSNKPNVKSIEAYIENKKFGSR